MDTIETRNLEVVEGLEIRLLDAEGNQPRRLVGYAAVWDSLSADLGGFREKVAKGAFTRTLASGADVRVLVDHDPSRILGRTANRTARIAEDDKGLRVEVDLPDTSYARDLAELVRLRTVGGMSFAFKKRPPGERWDRGQQVVRTLTDVDLLEATFTSIPAYPATEAALRVDPAAVAQARALANGETAMAKRRQVLRSILARG